MLKYQLNLSRNFLKNFWSQTFVILIKGIQNIFFSIYTDLYQNWIGIKKWFDKKDWLYLEKNLSYLYIFLELLNKHMKIISGKYKKSFIIFCSTTCKINH